MKRTDEKWDWNSLKPVSNTATGYVSLVLSNSDCKLIIRNQSQTPEFSDHIAHRQKEIILDVS